MAGSLQRGMRFFQQFVVPRLIVDLTLRVRTPHAEREVSAVYGQVRQLPVIPIRPEPRDVAVSEPIPVANRRNIRVVHQIKSDESKNGRGDGLVEIQRLLDA